MHSEHYPLSPIVIQFTIEAICTGLHLFPFRLYPK